MQDSILLNSSGLYVPLLVINTITFLIVIYFYARHRASSWFHPLSLYILFHGLVFVLRPWFSFVYNFQLIYIAYQFTPDQYAKNMTLISANAAFLCFAIFSLKVGNKPIQFKQLRAHEVQKKLAMKSFIPTFVILFPIFVYSIRLGWLNRLSDKAFSYFDRQTGTIITNGADGYSLGATNMSVFFLPVVVWLMRFNRISMFYVVAMVIFLQGIGTRGVTVVAIACMSCFYLYDRKLKWPDLKIISIVVPVVLLFNAVGSDRGKAFREFFTNDHSADWKRIEARAPLEGMDLGNMEMVEYIINVVPRKTQTYEYFIDQLQIFTEPVPRAIWKDKPVGQPIRFYNLFDYGFPVGMTKSIPGEGWSQYGFVGVIIWSCIWGYLMGKAYQFFARSDQSIFPLVSYFMLLSLMVVCYRDGLLLSVARYSLFAFIPLLVWYGFARLLGVGYRLPMIVRWRKAVTAPNEASGASNAGPPIRNRRYRPRNRRMQPLLRRAK